MKTRHFAHLLMIVLAILVILGQGQIMAQSEDSLEDLPFFLTFVPNIQFVPVYAAVANGHFAETGLNAIIEHGDEPVVTDLIANNSIQFGIISGEQVIMARAGERPVVYVYEWFQTYPVGVVVPDTTEVATVADLTGLKVGVPGRFGASYSGLTALLGANNMSEADIRLEPIGYVAPDVICVGGVDASVVYVNNEPLQIQQRADAGECGDISSVRVIRVADHVDMVSNGLVTNETTIANQPELVQAVVYAFNQGLQNVINNPAQAYLIGLDYVENLPIDDDFQAALESASADQIDFLAGNPTREETAESRDALLETLAEQFDGDMLIQFRVLLATIDLWEAEQLGYTDPESWELTLSVLEMMDMLPGEIDDLSQAYTNDFLPPVEEEVAE